jgi:Kef-type K+ transport system membrane component KefB/Trk K+ transport system NAD-binding subunit
MAGSFYEIVAILGIAALLGAVGLALRQPLIVAFLATGILVGPSGFSIVQGNEQIDLLARIGISLLLFVVGLRLDVQLIRTTGPVALATGIGQVVFTSIFGFLIAMILGFSVVPALYIAVALTFSSTIIIVKLLSDKKELGSLHGRIAIGFLIVQDIVAILAMIMLTAIGGGAASENAALSIVLIVIKGIAFLVCLGLLMVYVLPGLTKRLAVNQELLVLFAIAWAVFVGAAGEYLGFSKEVGAFLAGVALASTPYREAIAARLVSVRDFLLLFFFIDLGSRLQLGMVGPQIVNSIYLSVFVLVGNPIIVLAIMGFMGYRRRTGFLAGLTVAQISEFSLILGALGVSLGHIGMEAMSLITLVGVVTICISTYMIIYSGTLYRWISSPLRIFERSHPYREETVVAETCITPEVDTILIGLGNYGSGIAEHLLERKRRVVGVDFDPQALAMWRTRGLPVIFGDVGDPEFFDILPLHCSAWVVSTVRDRQLNLTLLHILNERRYEGRIAIAAQDEEEARAYQSRGADLVLRPFSDASEEAADSLSEIVHLLPGEIDWRLAVAEIRLRRGSVFAGQLIRDLNLRELTGISIVAVSRAGRAYLNPDPDFQLFPTDRLVLVGDPGIIQKAEEFLQQLSEEQSEREPPRFATAEVEVDAESEDRGRSLAEIKFREQYAATVIGIIRKGERILMPKPDERLRSGDRLMMIGAPESLEKVREVYARRSRIPS